MNRTSRVVVLCCGKVLFNFTHIIQVYFTGPVVISKSSHDLDFNDLNVTI